MRSTINMASWTRRLLCALAASLAVMAVCVSTASAQGDQTVPTKTVTITFKDAQVRTALEALFKYEGLNYAIDPAVSGVVTVDLHNVPFEIALRTILRGVSPALSYEVDGTPPNEVYTIKPKETVQPNGPENPNPPTGQPPQPGSEPTPAGPTAAPAGGINLGEFEVIKLNYVDARAIATVFGPLPGQPATIIIPPMTTINGNHGGTSTGQGGFGQSGQQRSGGYSGTGSGYGGSTTTGYGGTTGTTGFGTTGGTTSFGGTTGFGGFGSGF